MSIFRRNKSKHRVEPDVDSIKSVIASADEKATSSDITNLIRQELAAQEARKAHPKTEAENPFDVEETPPPAQEETSPEITLARSTPDAFADEEDPLDIDNIRANILKITQDWRQSAAAAKPLHDDVIDDETLDLSHPLSFEAEPAADVDALSFEEEILRVESLQERPAAVEETRPLETQASQVKNNESEMLFEEDDFDLEDLSIDLQEFDEADNSGDAELSDAEIPETPPAPEPKSEQPAFSDETFFDESVLSFDDFNESDDLEITASKIEDIAETAHQYTPENLGKMSIGELRLVIARITSDIENGSAIYSRVRERVGGLTSIIQKADLAIATLNQLQPENLRLNQKNRALETDLKSQKYITESLERDRIKLLDSVEQGNHKNELLRSKFKELSDVLEGRNKENEDLLSETENLKMELEQRSTDLNNARREIESLNKLSNDLSEQIQKLSEERVEIQRALDSAQKDIRDAVERSKFLEGENGELRTALRTSNRHNSEMHNELMEIQDKIVVYKSQHDTHIHRRDDKINVLEARIKELESKIRLNDDTVRASTNDVQDLKKLNASHKAEREKLEKIIETQNYELSATENDLHNAREKVQDLQQRYDDLARAISDEGKRPGVFPPKEPTVTSTKSRAKLKSGSDKLSA